MGKMSNFEKILIGALLRDRECAKSVFLNTTDEWFQDKNCQAAFRWITEQTKAGKPMDTALLADELGKIGMTEAEEFITGCLESVPAEPNVSEYCRKLKEAFFARKLRSLAESLENDISDGKNLAEIAAAYSAQLMDVASKEESGLVDSKRSADEFREFYYETKRNPFGSLIKTNYPSLDKALGGGLLRSSLLILGGRPGMGKSSVAISLAENIASEGVPVLFISLEMDRRQIMAKRLSRMSAIPYTKIMNGSLPDEKDAEIESALSMLENTDFMVMDESNLTVAEIETHARSIEGLGCIIVDYLGLMACREEDKGKIRYDQITNISGDLKKMAKRLQLPVIALCQLNRETDKNNNRRPTLTDLRDSGAIEQDADYVLAIYRENYYKTNSDDEEMDSCSDDEEDMELIVLKNRHAKTGTCKMTWFGSTGSIAEKCD